MSESRLVYGWGINDSDYSVTTEIVVGGKRKRTWMCPFYRTWTSMLQRCYSSACMASKPSYKGCLVCDEWKSFMAFRKWMLSQDWNNKSLDKDIIEPGNKEYCPEKCAFISQKLNSFVLDRAASRGDLPIGVCLSSPSGKYAAYCKNPFIGKQEYLGVFPDPAFAHEAWRKRKHEIACQYADMQTDQRVASALRTRYAPEYCYEIERGGE